MFASIRRHQKWLWFAIISLVIFSFVVLMDPTYSSRQNRPASTGSYGSINGRDLTREEVVQAGREAILRFFLSYGRWPTHDETTRQMFNEDRETAQRLVLLEKVRELDLRVSDEAVADWIAHNFRDRERGVFRMEMYQQILQRTLIPNGFSAEEFQEFVRHEVGIQHLVTLGGLSGSLITPREAETLFRRENEQRTAEVVLFSASNYLAGVTITEPALQEFYSNNVARYFLLERVQVSYVRFDVTNFLAEADQQLAQRTNLTAALQAEYQRRGANFFTDATGAVLSPEAAMQKIREEVRQNFALIEARKKATAFAEQLYEQYEKQPQQTNNLENVAAALGYTPGLTEPFTRFEGPRDLKVLETFAQVAFALTPEQPMASEPLIAQDAVYVIALKRKLPREQQAFDTVREKLTEDYRRREALQAAQRAGQAFNAALTNGLAQNKTFETICFEANVRAQRLPPFSLSTQSLPEWEGRVDLNLVKDLSSTLQPGKVSEYTSTRDGGMVLRLISTEPVAEARVKAELPAQMTRLREERQREAFNEWFRKEFELAQLTGLPTTEKSSSSTSK